MLAYLDSSALVKLVKRERETDALMTLLRLSDPRITSALSKVEVGRVARRADRGALVRARAVFSNLSLLAIDEPVLGLAEALDPPPLRTLDAIHLASALSLGEDLGIVVTYDRRMREAATKLGLEVVAPK